MIAPTGEERVAIRGPVLQRVAGWGMCAIVVVGVVNVAVDSGPLAAVAVGVFWAIPGLWWGTRVRRIGVVAERQQLVVRNPFATHRIAYTDIVDVRVQQRHATGRTAGLLFRMFNRQLGVVDVSGRENPIKMTATEALWPAARFLSRSRADTIADVETIRSVWLERRSRYTGDPPP